MTEWNISTPTTEYYDHESRGLGNVINEVIAAPEVAIDTETTGLNIWKDVPLYWSLAWGNRRMTLNVSALAHFAPAFADPKKKWIFANAKYDAHILANVGVNIAGKLIDTQVQHALLYEERSHRLKDMADHLFGWRWMDFQDSFGRITKTNTPTDIIRKAEAHNFDMLVEYAANDAWGTWAIYLELTKQLQQAYTHSLFRDKPPYIETLHDLFTKVETPYTKVLWKNERNGILVDQQYLSQIEPTAAREIADLEKEICKEAGGYINPNSTKQLREYFFDKMQVKPLKKTKGGKSGVRQGSVDSDFLEHYAGSIPMAKYLMDHRKLAKLHGTYILGLSKIVDPYGRVHTTFNQDVARTGRLSSKEPNLQNIPKPDNDKWKIRGAFIPSPGNKLIVGDYEQLEMRLLACASLDQGMIDVINRGWDIHMGNASLIFSIPYEEIKEAKRVYKEVEAKRLDEGYLTERIMECIRARDSSKTTGFAVIYGLGIKAMARRLGITEAKAADIMKRFNKALPAAEAFKQEAIDETERTGFAFTIMGRRRNVPQILSNRRDERAQAERIAVNTPIQGSAADVVKMAQILLDKAGLDRKYNCHSLLQVHDELAFECPADTAEEALAEIKDWMEHPFSEDLAVPLGVDIAIGNSWLEAKA